jgi:hypothetical protein
MWEPQRFTTLRASPACYRDSLPLPAFRKKKKSGTSETLVPMQQSTQSHIPYDRNLIIHRHGKCKSGIVALIKKLPQMHVEWLGKAIRFSVRIIGYVKTSNSTYSHEYMSIRESSDSKITGYGLKHHSSVPDRSKRFSSAPQLLDRLWGLSSSSRMGSVILAWHC